MSINIIQLVQGALTESVLQQLATRLGVAPEAAKRVVGLVAPSLVGSLMNKAASPEGARSLFATIMSHDSNANIVDTLPQLLHADGLQSLLATGTRLSGAVATPDRMDALNNTVARQTGVSAGSTQALTAIVVATRFGALKHYFSKNTGNVGQLPTLLGHQLPMVKASLTEEIASALGLGSATSFLSGVAAQMKAVSSHLEHPSLGDGATPAMNPSLDKIVVEEKAKSKKWWWVAVLAALALLRPPVRAQLHASGHAARSGRAAGRGTGSRFHAGRRIDARGGIGARGCVGIGALARIRAACGRARVGSRADQGRCAGVHGRQARRADHQRDGRQRRGEGPPARRADEEVWRGSPEREHHGRFGHEAGQLARQARRPAAADAIAGCGSEARG
jgi:hypothetical protein